MEDRIVVFVNTKPVALYRGMQVKHALISYDYPVYEGRPHFPLLCFCSGIVMIEQIVL